MKKKHFKTTWEIAYTIPKKKSRQIRAFINVCTYITTNIDITLMLLDTVMKF